MVRSRFEEKVLSMLSKSSCSVVYECCKIPFSIPTHYIPDLQFPNGIFVELKGRFREDSQKKMAVFKETYPNMDVRFFFANSELPVDGRKMTCAEYANKHGYKYTDSYDKLIEWYNE